MNVTNRFEIGTETGGTVGVGNIAMKEFSSGIQLGGNQTGIVYLTQNLIMDRGIIPNPAVLNPMLITDRFDAGTNNTLIVKGAITSTHSGVANRIDLLGGGTGKLVLLGDVSGFNAGWGVSGGSIQVGDGGTAGSLGANNVVTGAGGTVVFNRSDFVMYTNVISGSGGLTKQGAQVLELRGANTYTGATTVTQGTLRLGAGASISGQSAVSVASGATLNLVNNADVTLGTLSSIGGSISATGTVSPNLTVQQAADGTVAGNISGLNSFTKAGTGKLTINGDLILSGSGGVHVTGGSLVLAGGNISSTHSGEYAVSSGATLVLSTGSNTILTNVITGAGNVTKQGGGILELQGANTYTGTTRVEAGTLRLGVGGSLSAQSTVVVLAGATFDVGGNNQTIASLSGVGGSLTGTGALTVQLANDETVGGNPLTGFTSFDKTGVKTLSLTGDLNYTGQVKVSGGTLVLSGNNTLSGGIQVNGTLRLGSNNAAGGAGNRITTTGSVIDYADGVNTATPITINSNTTQVQVLTGAATQSGVISETGGPRPLEKIGAGTLIFSGGAGIPLVNTYTGATTLTAGTLQIDDNRNLGDSSATNRLIFNGGTLRSRADITMTRGVTVNAAGGSVWTDNNVSSLQKLDFSNGIQFNNGTLTKIGGGQLHVGGVGSGSGTLVIDNGALFLNSGTALGSANIRFAGNTTLSTAASTPVTFANPVTVDMAVLVTNPTNTSITLSGPVTGAGSFNKTNLGTFNLTGNNTFTGGVTLGAGTLGVGGASPVGTGPFSAAIGATLRAVADASISNNILLTNSAIPNGNNLFVDTNGFNMTLSGVISTNVPATEQVQPGLTKNGAGTLTLSGANTYRGATVVNAGTLVVNGSIANTSSVTIANGAKLGGNAAIPNLVVHSGATLSPGNSIGTVNIAGNLTLNAGSTTVIEIQGYQSDRIVAGGTAAIAGTLNLVALGGTYVFASPYTIITAAGGRTGTFATVNTDAAFGVGVTSTVTYNPNAVLVTLNAAPLAQVITTAAPTTLGLSRPRNAVAVAAGMDRAVAGGANASAFFNIYNQPTIAALTAAVNSLSGEVHASASAIGFQSSDQFLRVMLDPTNIGRNAQLGMGRGISIWGAAYGQTGRTNGENAVGSARRSASDWNMAFGADFAVHPTTIVGVAASGGQATASLSGRLGTAKADVFQFGVNSMSRFGAFLLNLAGSWSVLDVDTDRTVPALGAGAVKANYRAQVWSGRAEAAYAAWRISDSFAISPFAAIQGSSARTPGFVEKVNGGIAAHSLAVNGQSNGQVRGELGMRLDVASLGPNGAVKLYARAAWGHYFTSDSAVTASLTGLPGSAFKVTGARPSQNSALLGFGADVTLGSGLTFGAGVNAELAGRQSSIGGSAKLRMAF